LLGEGDRRIVVGKLTSLGGVLAGKGNAVVDVEDAARTTGRPDSRRSLDAVLLGVDLAVEEGTATAEAGTGGLLLLLTV
jgi:hypothetical protein